MAPLYADVRAYCSHVNTYCKDGTSVVLSSIIPSLLPSKVSHAAFLCGEAGVIWHVQFVQRKPVKKKTAVKEYNGNLSTFVLGTSCNFCLIAVPSAIQSIQTETLVEGSSRNLTCNVSGIPPPNVTWIEEGSGQRTPGNVLRLIDIYRNQSGEYRCEARNRCGNKSVSTFVDVLCK